MPVDFSDVYPALLQELLEEAPRLPEYAAHLLPAPSTKWSWRIIKAGAVTEPSFILIF